jgi:hypothetical protein
MKENNNKENKILTKREILKKINLIDSRIKKSEQELKLIELKWKKKKDSITLLKKDFETHLQFLHTSPEKSDIVDKES